MRKMKRLVYILLVIGLFSSCSEYQKVLNKGKNADRYKLAVELYEKEDYSKAIPLFEKLIGPYSGKPQMERIQYMIADSYYQTEDYSLSSYYFSKFVGNYPQSSKIVDAAFLGAKSYFLSSPKYSLDQQDTQKALTAFQNFIDTHPNSKLSADANQYFGDITTRLERKDFEIAKQYYHTEHYSAAITAFDTFNEDHLGSKFKEDALYLKFRASHDLGMKSVFSKKRDRLLNAQIAYSKFQRSFPKSDKMKEVTNLKKQIDKELDKTNELITTISKK